MNFRYLILFFLVFTSLKAQKMEAFADTIATRFKLPYTLTISNDPISARNTFLKNPKLVAGYFNYVTQQDQNWYLRYFNLNSLRRWGWANPWELYNNRFLAWTHWRHNLFLSVTNYNWYIPLNSTPFFNRLTSAFFAPVVLYQNAFVNEQWVIQSQIENLNRSLNEGIYDGNTASNMASSNYLKANSVSEISATQKKKLKPVKNLKTVIRSLRSHGVVYETVKQRPASSAFGRSYGVKSNPFTDNSQNQSGTSTRNDAFIPRATPGAAGVPSAPVRVQTVVTPSTGYATPNKGNTTSVSAARKQ